MRVLKIGANESLKPPGSPHSSFRMLAGNSPIAHSLLYAEDAGFGCVLYYCWVRFLCVFNSPSLNHWEVSLLSTAHVLPKLSWSDWVIFGGGWRSCENPPRTKGQGKGVGEKKASRLRALEKLLRMEPGMCWPCFWAELAFQFCWQEASSYHDRAVRWGQR